MRGRCCSSSKIARASRELRLEPALRGGRLDEPPPLCAVHCMICELSPFTLARNDA